MKLLTIGGAAVFAAVSAGAEPTEYVVPDYERWPDFTDIHMQVSNALARCRSGDVVTIRAGEWQLPDDALTAFGNEKVGAWMPPNYYSGGVTLRGDPTAGRDKVILRGGANHAVVYARNRAMRIEGLTFADCTNARGRAVEGYQDNTKTWSTLVISNCAFRGTEPNGGAGVRYATVVDCVFTNCFASSGGGAADCRVFGSAFAANAAQYYGGAASGCPMVSNCTFAANSVTGSVGDGGALNGCGTVIDCHFEGNYAVRWGGALNSCADVRDCTFGTGNRVGGVVSQSSGAIGAACGFTRCTFTGRQGNEAGSYTACIFSNMTVAPVACRTNGSVALTNCLFAANALPAGSYAFVRGGLLESSPCTAVNCTFVANDLKDASLLNAKFCEVKNCLFFGNTRTVSGKTVRDDVNVSVTAGGKVTLAHNGYGETSGAFAYDGEGNFVCTTPRFMKDRDPAAPYWSLRFTHANRALREDGLVEDWMTAATDLAGLPRLRDGKVGVGCYACWQRENGALLLFR